MSKIKKLQNKYPEHNIRTEPLKGCPMCGGSGEYETLHNKLSLCMCTSLTKKRDKQLKILKIAFDVKQGVKKGKESAEPGDENQYSNH